MKKILTAAAVALLATAAPAFAAENLAVNFTAPAGAQTTGTYFGLVNVTVSGTGVSNGTKVNDAFYSIASNGVATYDPGFYQLAFGTTAFAGPTASQSAANFIVGGLPAYNANNSYTFTLNTGIAQAAAQRLFFRVNDGVFSDNSGAFALTIAQAVPEPATWAMMLMGFGMIGFGLRSYQRKSTKVTYA